jgi:hypothetical protein
MLRGRWLVWTFFVGLMLNNAAQANRINQHAERNSAGDRGVPIPVEDLLPAAEFIRDDKIERTTRALEDDSRGDAAL